MMRMTQTGYESNIVDFHLPRMAVRLTKKRRDDEHGI